MTDNHVPPHLTIMSVEAREEEKLTEVMEQLERSLTKEQMQEAFAVMQEQFVPMEVTVSEIGLAKTNPHQDLVRIELND